jgi:hypothetical protein
MDKLSTASAIMITGLAISMSIFIVSTKFKEVETSVDYDNAIRLTKIILSTEKIKTKNIDEKIDLYVSTYEKILNKLSEID